MNEFQLWFGMGQEHILDIDGYDHILFVSILALTFPLQQWRRLLILITAFTLGHSLSLAFSVITKVYLPQTVIELVIALSILLSAIYNLVYFKNHPKRGTAYLYVIAAVFGLVHGLGFSFLLRSMLGNEQGVFLPLLYFNLGLELGQIIIVGIVLVFSLFLTTTFKWPFKTYKPIVICIIAIIALKISAERFLDLFRSS